ncbi:hypothetical protein GUJ93_ZPchr0002g23447 [Zizania palustris]|uniref:Uncharacterized protein n=1 Tax=Zizania palustris TaxID=103762 RepID=A0A8J5VUP1_ZIZPA|nr:hypothetical protein GUJ93_ZPchr0002g23447 [Zizania palustris]
MDVFIWLCYGYLEIFKSIRAVRRENDVRKVSSVRVVFFLQPPVFLYFSLTATSGPLVSRTENFGVSGSPAPRVSPDGRARITAGAVTARAWAPACMRSMIGADDLDDDDTEMGLDDFLEEPEIEEAEPEQESEEEEPEEREYYSEDEE